MESSSLTSSASAAAPQPSGDANGLKVSYHTDAATLATMLELSCEGFSIERIESVAFESLEKVRIIECLWARDGAAG